ncbi:MAG: heme ABC transporter ATP-binding protein [Chloroflexi bacterium]|nr:heme ABC transporter ATP-binding protein [Chloroflexota bacterium]
MPLTSQAEYVLYARGVSFSYYDGDVLSDVTLKLQCGELVGLIGPNGSGKTTLLKLLSGLLKPKAGAVYLGGRDVRYIPRREMARRIAVVPQDLNVPFAFTVHELVMMGRTPYIRAWRGESKRDRVVVERVMEATGTIELAERPFNELSGGEQRRVVIAMALAQEPEILLLDEPTVHLDINHQVEMLELIKRLNAGDKVTVLAAIHDLNLAALYFERLVLLNRGRLVVDGPPERVLNEFTLRGVFGADVRVLEHPTCQGVPQITVLPHALER